MGEAALASLAPDAEVAPDSSQDRRLAELGRARPLVVCERWCGGGSCLLAIGVYDAGDHWHFVTRGLRRVLTPGLAGNGERYELTLRAAKTPEGLPEWPLTLLQRLADYVAATENALVVGDHVDLRGPLAAGSDTLLEAIVFAEDEELGSEETPLGKLSFLQAVGITRDELEALKSWRAELFLELLAEREPLLVTDLGRESIRAERDTDRAIRDGISRDGSSQGDIYTTTASFRVDEGSTGQRFHIFVGESVVADLRMMLRSRLPFGRPFRLRGPRQTIVFWPGGAVGRAGDDDESVLYLHLSSALALILRERLRERPGIYAWKELPGLTLEVLEEPCSGVVRAAG